MKNWLLTLCLALAACALSFGAFYAFNRPAPELREAARSGDAMAWLRTEFELTDQQFTAIKQLHDDYAKVCARHCNAIAAAHQKSASRDEIAALEAECVRSMTGHFTRVASLMAPAQGQRYLAIVLPRIGDYDHRRGAPDVQAVHHHH